MERIVLAETYCDETDDVRLLVRQIATLLKKMKRKRERLVVVLMDEPIETLEKKL